jgi:hypothetical protein
MRCLYMCCNIQTILASKNKRKQPQSIGDHTDADDYWISLRFRGALQWKKRDFVATSLSAPYHPFDYDIFSGNSELNLWTARGNCQLVVMIFSHFRCLFDWHEGRCAWILS